MLVVLCRKFGSVAQRFLIGRSIGVEGLGAHRVALAIGAGAAMAVAAATASAGAVGAVVGLGVGVARVALFLSEQGLPVGDRDLVIIGMDFRERQEAVAVAAVIDERRLQRRFNPGDFGEIDITA